MFYGALVDVKCFDLYHAYLLFVSLCYFFLILVIILPNEN